MTSNAAMRRLLLYLSRRGWTIDRQGERLELRHPNGASIRVGWPDREADNQPPEGGNLSPGSSNRKSVPSSNLRARRPR